MPARKSISNEPFDMRPAGRLHDHTIIDASRRTTNKVMRSMSYPAVY